MNKIKISLLFFLSIILLQVESSSAKENVGQPVKAPEGVPQRKKLAGGCLPASAKVDLDINNVRARIMNGGDMWWDLTSSARYEIPKSNEQGAQRKHSLFAGALWIGGFERNNLKEAAMTYRQNGSDFWPGPLDTVTASTDATECTAWDKIYKLTRQDIDNFKKNKIATADILNWPAHGNPAKKQARYLAPFVDVNQNGIYEPSEGDYPDVKGDQALWFIYNDKGNIHTETNADAIGLEIQTQAFAFVTNDQISNMTFYKNTITNRSKSRLDSTYFGQWVDADLGYAFDDYVGCDTTRDLGFCYNGDNIDEGASGYGLNPPAVGVDFFEGPTADPNDGIDNNKNGVVDEPGEKIGMSKFVYYNNINSQTTGNPAKPLQYYMYLTGRWGDGQCIKYGGDGRKSGPCTNYMFPSAPTSNNPNDWNERIAGNPVGDRRFLQSAGPFSLKPGARNNVTTGVVWARGTSGGPTGGFNEMVFADDKAQKLFENNFEPIIGPDAPDVLVRELDKKLVLSLVNINGSLTATESFNKYFPSGTNKPLNYRFEGYQIYQLKNSTVTSAELSNADKARQIAQVDIKNDVSKLINKEFDPVVGSISSLKVDGENKGIKHSFVITRDAFATGDDRLINNKFYYFMVVAYAVDTTAGVAEPYLAGRPALVGEVSQIKAVPHLTAPQLGGISLNADYGDGFELRRISGMGNSGNSIDIQESSINELFTGSNKTLVTNPVYVKGRGPVTIRVYDPIKVVNGEFEFAVFDTLTTENFEKGSRPNFGTAGNVTTTAGSWKFDANARLITSGRRYGKQAVQLQGAGTISTQFSVSNIAKVSVTHANTESKGTSNWELYYSTGIGSPVKVGATKTATGQFQTDTFEVTPGSGMRFEIRRVSGGGADTSHIVIDNIAFINTNGTVQGITDGYELSKFSRWTLYNKTTGRSVKADTFINADYEQLIPEWGLSVELNKTLSPGPNADPNYNPETNGFLEGVAEYKDPARPWLFGVPDNDGPVDIYQQAKISNPSNWIRAGKKGETDALPDDDAKDVNGNFLDIREAYEEILGGIVAPAPLVARSQTGIATGFGEWFSMGPLPKSIPARDFNMSNVSSVNLVFTSDRSKWTKCLVLEMGEITSANQGGAEKLRVRKKANPFKIVNGLPEYDPNATGEEGFSWFPGYAVNIETGERLNIIFGEDSGQPLENGADMLWNPTSNLYAAAGFPNPAYYKWGGKHWIYVLNSRGGAPQLSINGGVAYDSCNFYNTVLKKNSGETNYNAYQANLGNVMSSSIWVALPALTPGAKLLSPEQGIIPNDLNVKLRVTKPLATFKTSEPVINYSLPTYSFSTNGLAAISSKELGKSALDLVNVVPNPYYAFSGYETSQLDNRVRFTNLPAKCKISIYTLSGSLVRTLVKNENEVAGEGHQTYLDWNLRNTANIPIASGVYIIHVDGYELGSKVLKWFGVMRPLDLDTF